ncbi:MULTISPECIES: hypothetical protein [unclassified Endozoicomonas]|uniref:hypothetical protein n=1 Tax=unclassified Endozoicomonas TaxID=2644528 RepID=UPI0021497C8F|nr:MULTISPECIES: hypothetical protein [unclassified Endozoicomonas]
MALSSLIGTFLLLSVAHGEAEQACWLTTHINGSYNVDALSEIMETGNDVPLCVAHSLVGSGVEVGYVGYYTGAGTPVLACLYRDSSGSYSYSYQFQWLLAKYTQLQQAKTYNPYLKDPAGMTTALFLSKRVFEFCDQGQGEFGIFTQDETYEQQPVAGGDKVSEKAGFVRQQPNLCMESRVEKVPGEKRSYFSFGTISADGQRCELAGSRYYETVDSDNTHNGSALHVLATRIPNNQKCRFPEYVRGQIDVCKFDKGTDSGHYWIRDGKEMRHSAVDLSECALFNYKQRFCMDMKGHCIIGRKVKHGDTDHNRNHCYICNEQITQEAKNLDWNTIRCITP